jgi:thymidylate kinase
MKEVIVLNGIHGAGKSTLGERLQKQGSIYLPEIGRELRRRVSYTVFEQMEDFDRNVMNEELKRDVMLLETKGIPVIETWHPGNIAYAMIRNPKLAEEYMQEFNATLQYFKPTMVMLGINRQTFNSRTSENTGNKNSEDLWYFYKKIRTNTLQIYNDFNLNHILVDGNKNIEEVGREMNSLLRERGLFVPEINRISKEH